MTDDAKPRVPPLPREAWTDEARAVFAFWGEPDAWENGTKSNLQLVLANHPALANAYNTFGKHLLLASPLAPRAKELIVLRVSWRTKSQYEWHYHVGYALNLGFSLDEIAAVRDGAEAPNWNEHDRAVLRTVDELMDQARLSNETWAALTLHFNTHDAMDLLFTIGHYVMLSWVVAALGVPMEADRDVIGFDLKTASGVTPSAFLKPGEGDSWTSKAG